MKSCCFGSYYGGFWPKQAYHQRSVSNGDLMSRNINHLVFLDILMCVISTSAEIGKVYLNNSLSSSCFDPAEHTFFISNSIFHLSLELLTKFWRQA